MRLPLKLPLDLPFKLPPQLRRRRASLAATLAVCLAVGMATFLASPGSSSSAAPVTADLAANVAAPANFVHPGVLVSRPQLDFVKAKIQGGVEPWKSADAQMMASNYASLSWTAKPRAVVDCGSYSKPDNGCTDERHDAFAAYTDALAWYFTGNAAYAKKSIEIMDAWSAVIKSHTNSNAPLQTGWTGSEWPRAAELIKYTYAPGWPNAGRFATVLHDVYLPVVLKGSGSNGNWELTMMEAAVNISIFTDDKASYDAAVTRYLQRVPAFIYLASDGTKPKAPPADNSSKGGIVGFWQGQSTFVDGLAQETCRDFQHTGYGIASIEDVADTSQIQGVSLYPEVGERIAKALEFHLKYENGATVPSSLCGGKLKLGIGPIAAVGYDALSGTYPMPETQKWLAKQGPLGTDGTFVAWQTLTSVPEGKAKLPNGSTPATPATSATSATPMATGTGTLTPTPTPGSSGPSDSQNAQPQDSSPSGSNPEPGSPEPSGSNPQGSGTKTSAPSTSDSPTAVPTSATVPPPSKPLYGIDSTTPPPGFPSTATMVAGEVSCVSGRSVEGVWVLAAKGSGFAPWRGLGNGSTSEYLFWLPVNEPYVLHVGCGGSPAKWSTANESVPVDAGLHSFNCVDVAGVKYETCYTR